MKKTDECKLVRDLLPSYIDKLTNEVTNKFIEHHLSDCEECKKILKNMGEELVLDKINENKEIDYLKKVKRRHRLAVFIISAIGFTILFIMIKFALSYPYIKVYNQSGKVDFAQTLFNFITNTKPEPFETTKISHIVVIEEYDDSNYPGESITNTRIFTFDTEKQICIGVRWSSEGTPIKYMTKEIEENYITTYFQSITDVKIEDERVIYSLNIWNEKPMQEVKDMIYETFESATIIEY